MERWRSPWQPAIRSSATSTTFSTPRLRRLRAERTSGTRARADPDGRHRRQRRTPSSSRARARRTPTSSSSTTACSGPARRARSTAPPSAACSCSSTPTWPSPPTTCPLDGHLEVGNNALLAGAHRRGRGRAVRRAQARHDRRRARASPARASRRPSSSRACAPATGREPLAFTDGPDPVRTIGIVSGAGADHLEDAIAAGLDAFVTGEPAERSMARAREAGRPLPRRRPLRDRDLRRAPLGELLAERFGVRHVFVDVRTRSDAALPVRPHRSGPLRQIKLRLSETRAIRSGRCKQAGGTQLRWPFT